MKHFTLNFRWLLMGLLLCLGSSAWAAEVTDKLTQSWTGVNGTTYSDWSNKTLNSEAVYAGNSAGGNSSIQLRSNNNNSGIVTTTSGGKVKKITVTWNSNTTNGRTLNVYGKNSAYETAKDLYDSSKQGTLIGTIVCGTSTELTITDDYAYIGFRSASGAMYLTKVDIVWETGSGGGGSTTLEDNDLALTDAPIALNFDLYNNATAQTIHYTTSSTGEVSVESGQYDVSCYVDNNAKTISVTPFAVTNGSQIVTVNQAADDTYKAGSVTFTVTVTDSTPIPTHTATFSVNGTTSTQDFEEGAAITFPADPTAIDGKVFMGWVTTAITGTTNEAPTFVTSATMGDADVTYYAVFATKTAGDAQTVNDVINRAKTGITGTSYDDWSGKTANSSAVYAGNSAGGNDAIQLRSDKSTSGVITTSSGGKVKKVTVSWNSNTADGRQINIYGSNTAYSAATDLYDESKSGTLLGTLTKGKTELIVEGSYEYVGVRSKSGALYLNSIAIDWQSGTPDTYSDYCTTVVADTKADPELSFSAPTVDTSIGAAFTAPTLNTAAGFNGTVVYSSSDESVAQIADQDTGDLMILKEGTTTITATFAGNDDFKAGSASYTLTVTDNRIATTITQDPIVLDIADVATLTQLNPVVKDANDNVLDCTYSGFPPSVSYSVVSDDDGIIGSVDNNSGEITINGVIGTATLKAYYNLYNVSNTYKPSECTFTITVSDLNAPGTENNPYTVAQARAAIDAGTGVKGVYAKGVVSEIVTPLNTTYGNITYNISADGSTTADQLQAYRGKGIGGAKFTSTDDIQVGDEVVIYGDLTSYGSTYEFAQNNQLVTLKRPVTPSITVNPATVNATAAGSAGTINVTYNNITTVVAEVKFYESDGTTPATYNWLIADIDGSNNIEYIIDANDGAERKAYIKVYALDDDANDVYSELITFTQAQYVADYATLPFAYDGNGTGDLPSGFTVSGLGTYSSSPAMKFDGADDYAILKINERPGTLTFDIKGNGSGSDAWSGTFTVQTSEDGVTYTDLKNYTELSTIQNEVFTDLGENVRYIKWIYTEKKIGNVALGNISLAKYVAGVPSITITPDTYEMDAKAGDGVLPVTVTCANLATDPQLTVVFYESDGTTMKTYDWIEASIKEGKINGKIKTANTTDDARTAYFKVCGKDADGNDVYSNLFTFTQKARSLSIKADKSPYLNPWEVAANGDGHTFSIEYPGLTDPNFSVVFYTDSEATTTTTTPNWINKAEITTGKKLDVNVNSNDGAARSAYLKVYDTVSGLYSGLFTINQAKFEVDYATLPFDFDGGIADIETTDGLTQEGLESDYASSPYLKFNGAGDYVILKINERPGRLTFMIKGNGFSGGTFKVQTSEDGVTYTDLATYTDQNLVSSLDEEFNGHLFGENVRYIKWVYTEKDAGNIALGKINLAKHSTDPVVTVAETVINVDAKENYKFIDATYNYALPCDVVFYTDSKATTTTTTPDWISYAYNNSNGDPTLHIAANTGAERTAYLKVVGSDINMNPVVFSELITLTQEGSGPVVTGQTYTRAATITSGSHYIITNGADKAMGVQNENNRAAVDITISGNVATVPSTADVREVVIYGPYDGGKYTIVEENQGYLYAASSGYNYLRTEQDLDVNGQWTINIDDTDGFATIKAQGSNTRNCLRYNSGSSIFSCYEKGQQDIYLFEKDADSYYTTEIPIAAACTDGSKYYATFSKDCAIVVPNGMTASEVGIDADNKLVVTDYLPGAIIPANTGVLLKADQAEKYQVILATGGKSVMGTNNRLRPGGVTAEQMNKFDANCLFYRLTMQGGTQLGFWWGAANGEAFDSGANKAYLAIPKASAANLRGFSFDEDATGIESAELSVKSEEGAIYDLQGRKVTNATRGLYIVNGKKVFIK